MINSRAHHARLDRLAQTDVIGNQKIDAWHLDGSNDGIKLVVFDLDAATERRLNILQVRGRGGSPANSVQESIELLRRIESRWLRQRNLLKDFGSGFNLPNNL